VRLQLRPLHLRPNGTLCSSYADIHVNTTIRVNFCAQ
jgi:hypothetical protein